MPTSLWKKYDALYRRFTDENDIFQYLHLDATDEEIEEEIEWLNKQMDGDDNET
jgi:hypothetical protein